MPEKDYIYDVALSYSDHQRAYAFSLTSAIRRLGMTVYSGKWEDALQWDMIFSGMAHQKDTTRLNRFCKYIIVIFSKEYIECYWERMKGYAQCSINIIAIDTDGSIPEEWSTDKTCIRSSDYTVQKIASMIISNNSIVNIINQNKKDNIMLVTFPDGSQEKLKVLICFKLNDTGEEYVVYHKDEVDANGRLAIYTSRVVRKTEQDISLEIITDEEWKRIKKVLRSLSDMKKLDCMNFVDSDGIEIV